MPRGDGLGPAGMGPMTGRGAGFCSSSSIPGYASGFGRLFGGGRNYRRNYYFMPRGMRRNESLINEKDALNRKAEILEEELREIKSRLANLNNM